MSTATKPIDAVDLGIEELRATIDRYLNGVRDHEGRTRIAEQMDRVRESLPRNDAAVGLIREHRGPSPEQPLTPEELGAASPIDPEIRNRIEAALERASKGIRDPKLMREAAERMDRERQELRKRVGTVDLAVPLIREVRGER
jgi:hypothetical protein